MTRASSSRRVSGDSPYRLCLFFIIVLLLLPSLTASELESEPTLYNILNLPYDASDADVKKAYRLLALEYHPDKMFQFNPSMTDEEKNESNDIFLKVQEAYEVLHDPERRLQYDLKLTGVQYDIIEPDATHSYTSRPFNLFIKSAKFKLHFFADFAKPKVPDISIAMEVALIHSIEGLTKNQKYYRRVICPTCRGNGGLDGACVGCELCQGSGVAKLLYSHPSRSQESREQRSSLEQMTQTSCTACKGRGCFPTGKCENCHGSGIKMVEMNILVSVPKGFKNGIQLSLERAGHEDIDGRRGDVTVTVRYAMPPSWRLMEESKGMLHTKLISLDFFLHNRTFEVHSPLGDTVTVKMPKVDFQLSHLLVGFNITVAGHGLLTGERAEDPLEEGDLIDLDGGEEETDREETVRDERGDLIVHCDIDWASVSQATFQDLLLGSGWKKSDPVYRRICSLLTVCDFEKEKGPAPQGQGDGFGILPREITIISQRVEL